MVNIVNLNLDLFFYVLCIQVTSTYDTNICRFPCNLCLCPKEYLSNVNKTFEARTEQSMKEIYRKM